MHVAGQWRDARHQRLKSMVAESRSTQPTRPDPRAHHAPPSRPSPAAEIGRSRRNRRSVL